VFDLDGTLLDTTGVDDHCYVTAISEEFAIDCSRVEWSSFATVTDSGIAEALLARNGLETSRENLRRIESRFVALLASAEHDNSAAFRPIAGAQHLIDQLRSAGWRAAIATGAWLSSAAIKLRAANLDLSDVPIASCDGRSSRAAIVQHAIHLATQGLGGGEPLSVVLVGDAEWDVQTAQQLSLPFVGIASGEKRARLCACGVAQILADYSDFSAFMHAIRAAVVPRLPRSI
jgi:phosphoglycolate phosphatase-like HAD superfamily hydrolase